MQKISHTLATVVGALIICLFVRLAAQDAGKANLALTGIWVTTLLFTARSISGFSPIPQKQLLVNQTIWNSLFFVSVAIAAIGLTLVFFSGNEFHGRRRIQSTSAIQFVAALGITVIFLLYTIQAHKSFWKRLAQVSSAMLENIHDTVSFICDSDYFLKEKKDDHKEQEGAITVIAGCFIVIVTACMVLAIAFLRLYIGTEIFDVAVSKCLLAITIPFSLSLVYMTAPQYFISFGLGMSSVSLLYIFLLFI